VGAIVDALSTQLQTVTIVAHIDRDMSGPLHSIGRKEGMSSIGDFLGKFGSLPYSDETEIPQAPMDNGIGSFLTKFGGPQMTSYWFYNNTIEIRFEPVDHIYFKVEELGNLTALLNVSTVSHIVDRSVALIPWAAKVAIEKLLRTIPVQIISTGPEDLSPVIVVPMMSLAEFTQIALQAKTAHKDKLEDAGDVGHEAHAWIENYIKARLRSAQGEIDTLLKDRCKDERATRCTTAMLAWELAHNVRWIATEKKCYSREHECSGTLDGVALVDSCSDPTCCTTSFRDHKSLIDWKTSNYLYIEFLFQTAAYMGFQFEEFPDIGIVDRWVIRLGKEDAEFDPWYLANDTFKDDYAGFLACLNLKRIVIKAEERLKTQKQTLRAAKKAAKASAKELAIATAKVEKAAAKAAARLEKAEEKKRVQAEAKLAREAARAEAKRLKDEAKLAAKAPKSNPAVPVHESVQGVPESSVPGTVTPLAEQRPAELPPVAVIPFQTLVAAPNAVQTSRVPSLTETEETPVAVISIPMD